jgi:hypothetical protein
VVRDFSLSSEVPKLPSDRSVGAALFAYKTLSDGAILVSAAGDRYSLDQAAASIFSSISTDGRWYLSAGGQIRDLTGTDQRRLAITKASAWSSNGRWLLTASQRDRVEVSTGRLDPISDPSVIGVLDDGTLLASEGRGEGARIDDPKQLKLKVLDASNGRVLRAVDIDGTHELGSGEILQGSLGVIHSLVGPGDKIMLSIGGTTSAGSLVASLADGRFLSREPAGTVAVAGTPTRENFYVRHVKSEAPGGVEIILSDHKGGSATGYKLPAGAQVLLPGLSSWL